jgi:hypothetical protein
MYSNALDLKNGKTPFKEIFIQYGILTTLIHSIILDLFSNKIFMLNFITLIFYQFSILLITLSIKNLINKEFAIISYLILIMNHPIPWLPWSNYIAFFFITFCIFLLTQKKTNYIFGSTDTKDFLTKNYINIKINNIKSKFSSSTNEYCINFIKKNKKSNFDIIEIHNRPLVFVQLKKTLSSKFILYFHNDPLTMKGSKTKEERLTLLNSIDKIIFVSKWVQKQFFINLDK